MLCVHVLYVCVSDACVCKCMLCLYVWYLSSQSICCVVICGYMYAVYVVFLVCSICFVPVVSVFTCVCLCNCA